MNKADGEEGTSEQQEMCAVVDANGNVRALVAGNLNALASSRVLQENHSGSARTDFCSNHLYSSQSRNKKAGVKASSCGEKTSASLFRRF